MLPRSLRLSRQGFEHMKGLRRTVSPHFAISYGEGLTESGTAVIVSKKVVKTAVGRHFLKRRMRAALRPWSSPTRILIVSARTKADTLSHEELQRELSHALAAILGA